MGEPLNNADRVFAAVRLLNDPARLGIGARHITVSTSGVVPGIDRMIEELPQVNLAISLHAATDELRDELVPINRKWPMPAVVDAGRAFAARTGRRVSLEYVMIDGMNDTLEQAADACRARPRLALPRQPDPAQPDPRLALERDARGGIARFVGTTARGAASRSPSATPAVARSTPPAASCMPSSPAGHCRAAPAPPRTPRRMTDRVRSAQAC